MCQPNVPSLTNALIHFIENKDLQESLSQNGYRLFKEKYLLENVGKELITEIQQLFTQI